MTAGRYRRIRAALALAFTLSACGAGRGLRIETAHSPDLTDPTGSSELRVTGAGHVDGSPSAVAMGSTNVGVKGRRGSDNLLVVVTAAGTRPSMIMIFGAPIPYQLSGGLLVREPQVAAARGWLWVLYRLGRSPVRRQLVQINTLRVLRSYPRGVGRVSFTVDSGPGVIRRRISLESGTELIGSTADATWLARRTPRGATIIRVDAKTGNLTRRVLNTRLFAVAVLPHGLITIVAPKDAGLSPTYVYQRRDADGSVVTARAYEGRWPTSPSLPPSRACGRSLWALVATVRGPAVVRVGDDGTARSAPLGTGTDAAP